MNDVFFAVGILAVLSLITVLAVRARNRKIAAQAAEAEEARLQQRNANEAFKQDQIRAANLKRRLEAINPDISFGRANFMPADEIPTPETPVGPSPEEMIEFDRKVA